MSDPYGFIRVPREMRAIGVTPEEWVIEEAAEIFDDLTEPTSLWDARFRGLDGRVVRAVAEDLRSAGLLRRLDLDDSYYYVPADLADGYLEPVMHVYRLYDGANRLLYIGSTSRKVNDRLHSHRKKPWGSLIARVDVERVIGYHAGRRREAEAIAAENPIHNKLRPALVAVPA